MKLSRMIIAAGFGIALCAGSTAFAAATSDTTPTKHHDTAKGAAVGALAGHEMGHGHALAGAGVGAAIGHHHEKKAEQSGK